jgi:hypothetical protein
MDRQLLSRRRALLIAVGAGAVWMSARGAVASGDSDSRLLRRSLALLEDNERLRSELRVSTDLGEQPTGLASHAALKQRLDRIDANNAALASLLLTHAPVARTPAFGPQAARFRDYAASWRTRWTSATALRGSDPAVPEGLSAVLQAELSAAP